MQHTRQELTFEGIDVLIHCTYVNMKMPVYKIYQCIKGTKYHVCTWLQELLTQYETV